MYKAMIGALAIALFTVGCGNDLYDPFDRIADIKAEQARLRVERMRATYYNQEEEIESIDKRLSELSDEYDLKGLRCFESLQILGYNRMTDREKELHKVVSFKISLPDDEGDVEQHVTSLIRDNPKGKFDEEYESALYVSLDDCNPVAIIE